MAKTSFKCLAMNKIIVYLEAADLDSNDLIANAVTEYQSIMEHSRYVPKEYPEPVTKLGQPVEYNTVYCVEGPNGFIKKFSSLEDASLYIYSKSKIRPIMFNRLVKHLMKSN